MDCDEPAWYEQQDEALQTRIRMLACFTADLQGGDWRQLLPGASRGARFDRAIFDQIVDMLVAPLLSQRMQTEVRRSLVDAAPSVQGAQPKFPNSTAAEARIRGHALVTPAAHLWQVLAYL